MIRYLLGCTVFVLGLIALSHIAKAGPIPGDVQLQAVQQCIVESNQPAYCECLIDSMAATFIELGLSYPDKPAGPIEARIIGGKAMEECKGLIPIQQAEQP